jgi:hypothetical protein
VLAGLTVLVSAFLLFVLELVAAKALLPRFGGSPMVWTTSMLVYQMLLLAGYAYAHGLARRGSGRSQVLIHAALLTLALVLCVWRLKADIFLAGDAAAVARHPFYDLLTMLLGTVALPFIAVSATSPLVQHWQHRIDCGRSSYWLYAVSNIGSFVGLLAYPFLIEPLVGLRQQFTAWTLLFASLSFGLVWVAVRAWRAPERPEEPGQTVVPKPAGGRAWRERLPWLALPACTSALLLAATNELCQDLAVFPFLWVLPLSLYLLSFTLAFRPRPLRNLLPESAVVTVAALSTSAASLMLPAPVHVVSMGALVFVLCLAAHRELYRLRPAPDRLTGYYLWISAGSGLGATGVAVLAPACFLGYWEFQAAVLLLWLALVAIVALDPEGSLRKGDVRQTVALVAILCYMALNQVPERWLRQELSVWPAEGSMVLRLAATGLVAALAAWAVVRQSRAARSAVGPRLLAGLMLFFAECALVQRVRGDLGEAGFVARNFFGVVRVQEVVHPASGIHVRQLTHGRINHGWQYMNEELRGEPTSYHSPSTGIGVLVRALQRRGSPVSIGVTGLGAGALAAYPRVGDRIVFYEIDPQVVRLAQGTGAAFRFMNGCQGATETVLGDARQSLASEWKAHGSRGYDVLALDAFTSDAVPMHLLTREAFGLYLRHLKQPGGVLAVNVSNRFLNLEPVLADHAAHFGLQAILVDSIGDPPVRARSLWVLMAQGEDTLRLPELAAVSRPLTDARVAWTDQSCSPFRLLKWWSPSARHLRFLSKRRREEGVTGPGLTPAQKPGPPEA